jgi:hypothetical protein
MEYYVVHINGHLNLMVVSWNILITTLMTKTL